MRPNQWNSACQNEFSGTLRVPTERRNPMHRLVKLGFAAALLAGVASPVLAEDSKLNAAASTATSTTADPTATGSVNLSMDSFLIDMSSSTSVDLSGFTSTSNVE